MVLLVKQFMFSLLLLSRAVASKLLQAAGSRSEHRRRLSCCKKKKSGRVISNGGCGSRCSTASIATAAAANGKGAGIGTKAAGSISNDGCSIVGSAINLGSVDVSLPQQQRPEPLHGDKASVDARGFCRCTWTFQMGTCRPRVGHATVIGNGKTTLLRTKARAAIGDDAAIQRLHRAACGLCESTLSGLKKLLKRPWFISWSRT
ncbi:unnamed protein product [Phytophthora lilii]|uniref:Unnamed protein product n=1 Tax=Phytophthora lilii TaxID=2077276 RepID=A0A9W6U732_9STRA|nr:unnamed protein product [Phytophthora lilii]